MRVQTDLEPAGEEHLISAVELVYAGFPENLMDDYPKCTKYLAHATATLEHAGCKNLEFGLRWALQSIVRGVLVAKGIMLLLWNGTSGPSMAGKGHSEWTTLPLSTPYASRA